MKLSDQEQSHILYAHQGLRVQAGDLKGDSKVKIQLLVCGLVST